MSRQKLIAVQSIKLGNIIHSNLTAVASELPVLMCTAEMTSSWSSSRSHCQNWAARWNYALLP